MKSIFTKYQNFWNEFWFSPLDLVGISLMRLQLLAVMIYIYSIRWISNMYFFQEGSMVPRARALEIMPSLYRPSFSWFFWPDHLASYVHGLFVFMLVVLFLGFHNRKFAFFTWLIHLGFIQRNYSILFGADMIASVFLFYLSFAQSDEYFSIKSWIQRKEVFPKKLSTKTNDLMSSVMYRMIQVHLSIIYAYTGFEKLKGSTWWDGTALWTVFGNPQMVVFDMTWIRYFPLFISGITFLTILFEIYWPFGISHKLTRPWFLFLGISFHLGIALTMGLSVFSFIMLSAYWLWIDPNFIRALFQRKIS